MAECRFEAYRIGTLEPDASVHPVPDDLALNRQAGSPTQVQVVSGCLLPEHMHNWTWQHEPDPLTRQTKGNR